MQYLNGQWWTRGWGLGCVLALLLAWAAPDVLAQREPPDVTAVPGETVPVAGAVPPEEPNEPPPNNADPHQHVGNIIPVPTPLPIGRVRNVPLPNQPVATPIPIDPVPLAALLDDPVWSYGEPIRADGFASEMPAFDDGWWQTGAPVAVPEPATVMLALGALALLRRRH